MNSEEFGRSLQRLRALENEGKLMKAREELMQKAAKPIIVNPTDAQSLAFTGIRVWTSEYVPEGTVYTIEHASPRFLAQMSQHVSDQIGRAMIDGIRAGVWHDFVVLPQPSRSRRAKRRWRKTHGKRGPRRM